jgi:hypothetical protein
MHRGSREAIENTNLSVGYEIVLPAGWARIPLRGDADRAVDAILDRSFAQLPRDRYGPLRAELRKRILSQVAVARDNEGVDLYFPVEQMHGVTVAASFVVALLRFDSVEVPATEDVLTGYAAEAPDARLVEIDAAPAVRTERLVPGVPEATDDRQYGSRRVDYVIAIPHGADQWLTVSFSTVGDGDPERAPARLFVELFDAIMSTFRWKVTTSEDTP